MLKITQCLLLLLVLFVLMASTLVVGTFCLYLATLKYDWMIEHEMFKHAYAFGALATFGEVAGLLFLRRGVILAYDIIQITFFEESQCPQ